jgi:hypothetical protein
VQWERGYESMKEVYKNIYLEELPLPNNPLKYLNFYIEGIA